MKFRYNENVEIVAGFYTGQRGKIREHRGWIFKRYRIYSDTVGESIFIKESHLKSLDYPGKEFDSKLNKIVK